MVSGERLLLIAAEPREFSGLLQFCRNIRGLKWPVYWARSAELNGRELLLAANGAGMARSAAAVEAARASGAIAGVCSVGYCGAVEGRLKIGDVFVARRVDAHGREFAAADPQGARPHHSGVLASVDRVMQTAEEKARLRARGASAVEMEAGGAAAKAEDLGIPFYCIRVVTDLAGETFGLDFNAAIRDDGRFDTMRLIAQCWRRPWSLVPELIRLARRSRIASRALGEFVADCRF